VKVRVTFKSPDAVFESLRDVDEDKRAEVEAVASKFIEYEEYITVEIDTEAGTCVVVPL